VKAQRLVPAVKVAPAIVVFIQEVPFIAKSLPVQYASVSPPVAFPELSAMLTEKFDWPTTA